ncbi:MAG: helix-turn-helix domain-containing protein [Pseudonocardiaceae bacterium]
MPGPTIKRKQLGIELRRLREAAGVTRPEAAAALKCSPARIGHIEVGKNALGYAELVVLLRDHYGADEATLTTLEELRQEATKRGWWSTYGLPEWLAGYVGLEHDATSVRTFELELIPGLLQTEEYARACFALDDHWSTKEVNRRIGVRLQRQQRLSGPDPLQLTAVISEGALARCSQHPGIAASQLRQLAERASWPNIELRVLPQSAGLHVAMAASFSLLNFPDRLLPDAAHQEYVVGGHVIDDTSVVSQLSKLFDKLRNQALAPNESLTMIAELANTN